MHFVYALLIAVRTSLLQQGPVLPVHPLGVCATMLQTQHDLAVEPSMHSSTAHPCSTSSSAAYQVSQGKSGG